MNDQLSTALRAYLDARLSEDDPAIWTLRGDALAAAVIASGAARTVQP